MQLYLIAEIFLIMTKNFIIQQIFKKLISIQLMKKIKLFIKSKNKHT
jgi:hypothetical protein